MIKKKRRPFVAALMSLLIPGLGQVYAGRRRRGAVLFVVTLAFDWSASLGFLPLDRTLLLPAGFWISAAVLAVFFAWWMFAVVDAFVIAWRAGRPMLMSYQRWYIYAAVYAAAAGLIWLPMLIFDVESMKPTASYSIPSGGMTPAIQIGDYIIGPNLWYRSHRFQRGEIAVYIRPNGIAYIHRIVGLPGERIKLRDGVVYINDAPLSRNLIGEYVLASTGEKLKSYREGAADGASYVILERSDVERGDNMDAIVVPADSVFVIGDNRDNSADSRAYGPVPIDSLRDKPLYIWWSADLARIGTRLQ